MRKHHKGFFGRDPRIDKQRTVGNLSAKGLNKAGRRPVNVDPELASPDRNFPYRQYRYKQRNLAKTPTAHSALPGFGNCVDVHVFG